jgi:hypothetical protein
MGDSNYQFYHDITNIQDISGIVHNEQSRIDQKSTGIKTALESQNRMIFLNQSYASRMREYSYMIMIIAISLVLAVLVIFFQGFLPAFLVNTLILIILGIGFCWAVAIYLGIRNRDYVDFDKIYSTPVKDISGNAIAAAANSGDISSLMDLNFGTCIGSSCCPAPLSYDTGNNVCIQQQAFTLMEQAYNTENVKGTSLPKSDFSSLTFSSYT